MSPPQRFQSRGGIPSRKITNRERDAKFSKFSHKFNLRGSSRGVGPQRPVMSAEVLDRADLQAVLAAHDQLQSKNKSLDEEVSKLKDEVENGDKGPSAVKLQKA